MLHSLASAGVGDVVSRLAHALQRTGLAPPARSPAEPALTPAAWERLAAQILEQIQAEPQAAIDFPLPGMASDGVFRIEARLLGGVQLQVGANTVPLGRKLPHVPIALLKLLAVSRRPLPVRMLALALWPGADLCRARRSLDSAVYRLRALLGEPGAILHSGGALALNRALCRSDICQVEQLCEEIGRLALRDDTAEPLQRAEHYKLQLLEQYRGPLAGPGDPLPLQQASARLDTRVQRALAKLDELRLTTSAAKTSHARSSA
jgi:hypothetical protein